MVDNNLHSRVQEMLRWGNAILQPEQRFLDWDCVIYELKQIASSHGYQVTFTSHKRTSIHRFVPRDTEYCETRVINYYGHSDEAAAFGLAHEVGHLLSGHLEMNQSKSHSRSEFEAWEVAERLIKELRGEIPESFPQYRKMYQR